MYHDEWPSWLQVWRSSVKLPAEYNADGTRFVVVGNNVHMACRNRNQDRKRHRRNRQHEPREQKPPALGGQGKHAGTRM
jgi:hypothetical protein